MSEEANQVDVQLEVLEGKSEECFQKCQIRSAIRLAKEMTRLAKSHSLAIPYMRGLFDQMRIGHGMLDPQTMRDVSVELVLLLEDEEQARRIQPSLDENHYQWLCSWMTTCAYDNLAEATAMMAGCNSPGMHECISDGLQVCRETGKMECVKCFREYASDVYFAADDFDMVRHQCQTFLEYNGNGSDNKDRRWSGRHKLAKMHLLEGRIDSAILELRLALELTQAEDVYLKLRSKAIVSATLDEALLLAALPRFNWTELDNELPVADEWPFLELHRATGNALAAVLEQDYSTAIETLTGWDRRLTEQQCLKEWFEIRLRLIAAYLLDNNRKRAQNLAKGLEASAVEAQDFLTLRRLQRLLDPNCEISPIAALNRPTSSLVEAEKEQQKLDVETSENDDIPEISTPLGELLAEYMQRIIECGEDDAAREELLHTFVSHAPQDVEDSQDAAYLVHLSQFIIRGTDDAFLVWPWAEGMVDRFTHDPIVMSVVASLGQYFRTADPGSFDFITVEQLENWFRMSTSPNVEHAKNFTRAGSFYVDENKLGEAERCYSRAFRLDRTDTFAATALAELYRQSDRLRDGLAVLDLSLREGNTDQEVAWDAAMLAISLEQFDAVLTYLNKYLDLGAPETWAYYYRALSLFQLGKFEESLTDLERESDLSPPGTFHLRALQLCNLISLEREAEASALFEELLPTPFQTIDYLSLNQMVRILGQLWSTVSKNWNAEHPFKLRLEHRLLCAGLLPDEYFETQRAKVEKEADVFHYHVHAHQPLDASWVDSEGCLYGQTNWTEYQAEWGVLAENEEQAINMVLQYQTRCSHLHAEIVEIQTDEQEYRERPGVVWQGLHWSQSEQEHLDENEEFGDEDYENFEEDE